MDSETTWFIIALVIYGIIASIIMFGMIYESSKIEDAKRKRQQERELGLRFDRCLSDDERIKEEKNKE